MDKYLMLPVLDTFSAEIVKEQGLYIGKVINYVGGNWYSTYMAANAATKIAAAYGYSQYPNVYGIVMVSESGSIVYYNLDEYQYSNTSIGTISNPFFGFLYEPILSMPVYDSINSAVAAMDDGIWTNYYPINYYRTGCTITGPLDASPGQDCVITVNPNQGYTFKGSSGVRIVDSSGANVPFIVSGNQVSFTYPQPI